MEYTYGNTSTNTYLIYNPGTEPTPIVITLGGTSTGTAINDVATTTITNKTNGSKCVLLGITPGITTDAGKLLKIDTETARVTLEGVDTQMAFNLHDNGYIWLSPCTPFVRNIFVSYTNGSTNISSIGGFTEEMAGQYIYLNGAWRKIFRYVDADTLTLKSNMDATGGEPTQIVTMNEIEFADMTLTHLEMDYTPRVR